MDDIYVSRELTTASEISVLQLVNVLSDAAFVCDHTGHILVCSDEVLRFFDVSDKSKVIGSNFQSFIAYEFIDEAYFHLLSVVNEPGSRRSNKFSVKKGAKETFQANVNFASLQDDNQENKFVLITFREAPVSDPAVELLHRKDIRLSRLFETVINSKREGVERTKMLLSQIGETLGATTCSFSHVENNSLNKLASWESPFNKGISPELCTKQLFDYLVDHKEDQALIRKPLLSAFLESEPSYNDESGVKSILVFTIVNNGVVEGLISAVFTFNYSFSEIDQQFIKTVTTVFLNETRTAADPDLQPEFSFRQLIDCFSDPVYVLSPDFIIMDVNRGVCRYYGYEREDLIGQNPLIFSSENENDNDQFKLLFEKALNGEPQKFEWWGQRKNGEVFPKEIFLNKSKYYDRDVVIAIGRDLTELKKAEHELIRYNEELKESNVSKDKFFSILAHDLKNPFQGLLGFIDLLYEDLDELSNAQIKEYLSNVRTASYHTYALLENLLEWSRIQSGKMPFTPSVFNIKDEINSVITILDNNATRKEIKLVNEVDSNLMVEADRNMIHSVIQNLITNSIKFSNAKGRVVLRSRVPKSTSNVKSTAESTGRNWLEISIADNGIGIPEEILPKLFKLNGQYSQAGTANEPGTGLGLVLCHEMVEKNGGHIWAESIAGQGTTFIFTLPLSN